MLSLRHNAHTHGLNRASIVWNNTSVNCHLEGTEGSCRIVAQTALAENSTVKEVVLRLGLMSEAEFNEILGDVDKLVRPNG
jgi:fumarate hydratase class II